MAKSTRQSVFDGMEILPIGLTPFVEKRLHSEFSEKWPIDFIERLRLRKDAKGKILWDQQALLKCMKFYWVDVFGKVLGFTERSYVFELSDVRNKLAHGENFSYDDAERALDTMRRLLESVGAKESANKVGKMRETILRTKFTELRKKEERRKYTEKDLFVETVPGLTPWKDVIKPHSDVATGEFQQAEFAVDLSTVVEGKAPTEYQDPNEFFNRTYLTEGLGQLLTNAATKLSGIGGDPVVELQTNFGGGKTHSMLALYHMAGETPCENLSGLDQLLSKNKLIVPESVHRAVIVGTSRSPQEVVKISENVSYQTTWGEMAWQLGGIEAYELIKENDKSGIAPGSSILKQIFEKTSPNLILIDEWVAYLRQIYNTSNLHSGTFDSNLSFVQSLTEAVKSSPNTLLVAALPESDIEVGGEGGKEALARLKQTFSRVESSWLPATQEESYEIVRRRLFKEISGDRFAQRDATVMSFTKFYRDNPNDFPKGSGDENYRNQMEKSYPIHPELFDKLYSNWGSLERFQRTRGVLRIMAQVIHELWINDDSSVMIMPGNFTVALDSVKPELLRYLDQNWQSIIAGDIDGPNSIPYSIDKETPNIGKISATRRVARTIFLATAPLSDQQNQGVDIQRVNLGTIQPKERIAVFGDAVRRLTDNARFMHNELGRYWYSTSPNLNRIVATISEQYEEQVVYLKIDELLRDIVNRITDKGHFARVQVMRGESADITDEGNGLKAVFLGVNHCHSTKDESKAIIESKRVLQNCGLNLRLYRNTLIFLAADDRLIEHLKYSVRNFLAWIDVSNSQKKYDLKVSEIDLANERVKSYQNIVRQQIREAWCHVLYPTQTEPTQEFSIQSKKVSTQDNLPVTVSKKLEEDEVIYLGMGPIRLNRELEKYLWQDKDHLYLKDLADYFDRFIYLPRLKNKNVIVHAVRGAISGLTLGEFAYAERWNSGESKYEGLATHQAHNLPVVIDSDSVIVRSEVAKTQEEKTEPPKGKDKPDDIGGETVEPKGTEPPEDSKPLPKRFVGTVMIDPIRSLNEFPQIVEEIVEKFTTSPQATVELKLHIEATLPKGIDETSKRIIKENASALGFIEKEIF